MRKLGKVSNETRGVPIPTNKTGLPGETDTSQAKKFV